MLTVPPAPASIHLHMEVCVRFFDEIQCGICNAIDCVCVMIYDT